MSDIVTAQDGDILRITLNRPDAGNAMTDDMARELRRLLLGAHEASRLVVLGHNGADFCVGRQGMGQRGATEPEALERRRASDVVFDCYGAFREARVPIIGVIKGSAYGFGCAMASVCDITLASDQARFQVPEMAHNILPTMVMSALIDRVSRKGINYMVYSTAIISAERALHFGIVSEVVPAAQLDQAVADLCAAILRAPNPATEGAKEYMRRAMDMDIGGAVDFARNLHATVNSSSEMRRKH